MATTVTKTVKASGGDYTDLRYWEAGQQGDLTGVRDEISRCVCYAIDDTTAVSIGGWTTSATQYITIEVDSSARHAGKWDGDKYNLVLSNADAFVINENYVRVDGLQISVPAVDGAGDDPITITNVAIDAGNDIRLSNLILVGAGSTANSQQALNCGDASTVLSMWNCIAYNIGSYDAGGSVLNIACTTASIYSCTVIGGRWGILRNSGAVTVKNCYAGGAYTLDFEGDFTAVVNCASEDASSDDDSATNCITSVALGTDTFVNISAGTEDFHLAADGLSPLQAAGVDTTGDAAPLNFTTNIDGDTRDATWDIGADSWVVSAAENNVLYMVFES